MTPVKTYPQLSAGGFEQSVDPLPYPERSSPLIGINICAHQSIVRVCHLTFKKMQVMYDDEFNKRNARCEGGFLRAKSPESFHVIIAKNSGPRAKKGTLAHCRRLVVVLSWCVHGSIVTLLVGLALDPH